MLIDAGMKKQLPGFFFFGGGGEQVLGKCRETDCGETKRQKVSKCEQHMKSE